jgi:L-iditol 2-dehydrogenase
VREKISILREIGVDVAVDAAEEDVAERILEETGGAGADLIIETAGSIKTHHQALRGTGKRGRIVHIGRVYSDMPLPQDLFARIFRFELTVCGSVNSNFSPGDHEWETTVRYLSAGRLKAKPLISHRLPLSEISETFDRMFRREMVYNKIIFSP